MQNNPQAEMAANVFLPILSSGRAGEGGYFASGLRLLEALPSPLSSRAKPRDLRSFPCNLRK